MSTFSPRQKQVLQLVAEGLTIKQVAEELGISEGCAKDHFDNAKDKMPIAKGTRNRVIIVNWINKNLGDFDGNGKEQAHPVRHRGKVSGTRRQCREDARCTS